MKNHELIRTRYLADDVPVRLGGLAANLLRIKSFARQTANEAVVQSLIDESKWFIEWTAAKMNVEDTAVLVQLQIQLAKWEIQSHKKWHDKKWRTDLTYNSQQWSLRVLEMSGLL